MTLNTHTLDSVGQPTKSIHTINRVREYDIEEKTKQLAQVFVRLIDQPNSKFQLIFYGLFSKRADVEDENEDSYNIANYDI